ncbi:unnamed protein product, partial [Rotaria sordida]
REFGASHFLINLINSTGHVNFSSEVTAAFRATDDVLVVVDCVSGVGLQTETVLRKTIGERIKSILFISKMDHALLQLKFQQEDLFQTFQRIVENVDPRKATFGFSADLHGWAFTLKEFAEMYGSKFQIELDKLMNRLWDENFFSSTEKKWSQTGGEGYLHGFCQFVLDPIFRLFKAIIDCKKYQHTQLLEK